MKEKSAQEVFDELVAQRNELKKEITKTIIAMAKNLHMSVIAEGVETQEQSDFLLENGCSEIQGFLYHKPSPAHEIKDKLQNMFK